MIISTRDNKWHWHFTWRPVEIQTGYSEYATVKWQWVLRKYNENRASIGIDPFVYATENTKKFMSIRDKDIAA